jgi:type II secretory pathway component PulM
MNALLDWYRSRKDSEQRILLIGAILAPLMIVLLLLMSLYRNISAAETRLQKKQQDLVWLQQNAAGSGALTTSGAARGNDSLVTIIDRVARETGVAQALTGSQSSGNGGLRVRAEKAGFDALVAFLGALSTQYGVSIENATIESVGTAGIVNATLVLR